MPSSSSSPAGPNGRHSNDLVAHGKALAEAAGRPYEYKQGFFRKEALIDDIIRRDRLTAGLVAVLCVQETCNTVRLVHAQGRPVLVHARRPQRVLSFYYLDRDFGLMYVRIQSWFPFTVQVYVNGHSWLARQMTKRRMAFIQHDNAFTSIDDPATARPGSASTTSRRDMCRRIRSKRESSSCWSIGRRHPSGT